MKNIALLTALLLLSVSFSLAQETRVANDLVVTSNGDSIRCVIVREAKSGYRLGFKGKRENELYINAFDRKFVGSTRPGYYADSDDDDSYTYIKHPKYRLALNAGCGYLIVEDVGRDFRPLLDLSVQYVERSGRSAIGADLGYTVFNKPGLRYHTLLAAIYYTYTFSTRSRSVRHSLDVFFPGALGNWEADKYGHDEKAVFDFTPITGVGYNLRMGLGGNSAIQLKFSYHQGIFLFVNSGTYMASLSIGYVFGRL